MSEHKCEKDIRFAQLTRFPSMFFRTNFKYLLKKLKYHDYRILYKVGEMFALKHCAIWTNHFNNIW